MEPGVPHRHVLVAIEAGKAEQEELYVLALGDGIYRVLVPPLWTLGLGAGDEFLIDPETLRPVVVRRSGNLLVWLYPHDAPAEGTAAVVAEVEALGGRFEGTAEQDRVFVFTIPVRATFPAVEAVFDRFVADHPAAEWLFGNVYADDGETPLRWWESL